VKICRRCGQNKPLNEFYPHSQMADGHLNICKECTIERVKKYERKNKPIIIKKDRERFRNLTGERRANRRRINHKWRKTHPNETFGFYQKWIRKNPEKVKAHNALSNAVRDGKIKKSKICKMCGSQRLLHGHHESYKKQDWLNVTWVCYICHRKLHRKKDVS